MSDRIKISDKVAKFIKDKRLALGMSQREFAEFVFDDRHKKSWISRVEGGKNINLTSLERIFEKINADISFLEY